jgi:predicted site-specific integrase-resolvase
MEPLAVNLKTAANLLGISTNTFKKLEKSGKIFKKKIGSRSLYSVEMLKRFLEKEV